MRSGRTGTTPTPTPTTTLAVPLTLTLRPQVRPKVSFHLARWSHAAVPYERTCYYNLLDLGRTASTALPLGGPAVGTCPEHCKKSTSNWQFLNRRPLRLHNLELISLLWYPSTPPVSGLQSRLSSALCGK